MSQLQSFQKRQRGQVLIIVVLILLVVSLMVLGVAARSILDVKVSNTGTESNQTFSAAEAGVEAAVQKIKANDISAGTVSLPNGTNANYTITYAGNDKPYYLSTTPLSADIQTFQVNLTEKKPGGGSSAPPSICLYWGNSPRGTNPANIAIEANVIYQSGSNYLSKHYAIHPTGANNFTTANPQDCPTKSVPADQNNLGKARDFAFSHKLTIDVANYQILRLRLLYNTSPEYVGVSSGVSGQSLPTQGYIIESTGTTTNNSGTTRKVRVFQSYPALPGIFDFVLYNGSGSLTK